MVQPDPPGRPGAGPLLRLPSPGEDKAGRCATQEIFSKSLFGGCVQRIFPHSVRAATRSRNTIFAENSHSTRKKEKKKDGGSRRG